MDWVDVMEVENLFAVEMARERHERRDLYSHVEPVAGDKVNKALIEGDYTCKASWQWE